MGTRPRLLRHPPGGRIRRAILALLALALLPALVGVPAQAGEDPPLPPTRSDARTPLPPAVSQADIRIYRDAFRAAARKNWREAHRLARTASNPLGATILKWWDYSRPYSYASFEEIAGFESSPAAIGQPPYAERREQLGRRKWEILGRIAAADPAAIGLTGCMQAPAPEDCWRRELDYWEGVIDADELSPWPIARAAIRRLRRSPPPPAQKLSVVHGDFRTGNFLYDGQGGIHAILDWEMVHLGDPLEDLGL